MADPKAPPAAIPVVTPSGKVGYLPAQYAQDAGGAGLRKATEGELRGAQLEANQAATADALRAQFEGSLLNEAEGAVMPAVAAAARGVTVGLSDEALTRVGGDAVRKRLLDYQAYAPVTSTLGELGGILGAAALGDEAGLGALPNAIGRLGAGAEAAVASRLGGGMLAKGVGVLARGAAEGAVFGAGSAVSESALKDTDLSGEAIVGGMGHGALGGMVASGLLHGAGKAFSALRRPGAQAYDAIAAREFGEAAPGVGKAIAPEAEAIAGKVKAHPEDVLSEGSVYRSPGDRAGQAYIDAVGGENKQVLGEAWRNREILKGGAEDRLDAGVRDFTEAITAQQKASRVTDMATFGESKVNHMEKLVSPSNFEAQAGVVKSWVERAQQELAPLIGDVNGGLSTKAAQQFDGHVARLTKAMADRDGTKLFAAADDFKRFLGKQAQFGRSAFGLSEAARTFDSLYQGEGGLMRVLEDGAWGKAGEAQKAINAATAEHLGLSKRFRNGFTTEYGSTEGRPDFVGESSKVSSFMSRLTQAANDLDAKSVRDMISTRRAFLDATAENYDHGAGALKAINEERAALTKMEVTFEKATKEAALINQVKRLQAEESASAIGGFLGMATDTLSKPMTTLRRLAQVEEQTDKVLKKVGLDSRKLVGAAPDAAQKTATGISAPKAGPGFFSLLLKDAGKAADVGANATGAKAMRNEFERRERAIATMQANPQLLTKKVGDALGPLGDAAPKTTAAATSTAINGLNFLASKLPMSRQDPYSLTPQFRSGTNASDSEIAKHMRYAEALDNPTMVLDRALKGSLTPDHVEAVKAVYPKLYEQMRQEVFKGLVDARAPVPYGRRIQLGTLLDLPTDQTLAPDFVSAIQATYTASEKAGQEPPPPNLESLDVASSLETATQSASSEGLGR